MNDARLNAPRTPSDVVRALTATLPHLSAGDLAALRRMKPGDPHCPAFWRLVVGELSDQLRTEDEARREDERRWAVILAAMTNGLIGGGRRFGSALGDVVPEARVLRLLRAHDEALADAVRAVVHQLASSGTYFDPLDLARLVLSDGRTDEDSVRRHIYQDFYAVAHTA